MSSRKEKRSFYNETGIDLSEWVPDVPAKVIGRIRGQFNPSNGHEVIRPTSIPLRYALIEYQTDYIEGIHPPYGVVLRKDRDGALYFTVIQGHHINPKNPASWLAGVNNSDWELHPKINPQYSVIDYETDPSRLATYLEVKYSDQVREISVACGRLIQPDDFQQINLIGKSIPAYRWMIPDSVDASLMLNGKKA